MPTGHSVTCRLFGRIMTQEKKGQLPDYCIWDFNGTLLDDTEAGIHAVNDLLAARGLRKIADRAEYCRIFGFPIQAYYRQLGFDFEREPYEVLAPLWVERYLFYVRDSRLFDDVKETLARLQDSGVRQTVLSATEETMLRTQISQLGIEPFFEEILGLDNIHAASKLFLAEDWRHRHPRVRAVFLGDTDHDKNTADTMNASCLLIARGHQSADRLQHLGVPVLPSLRELPF